MRTRFRPPKPRPTEPIRDRRDIARIRAYLLENERYGGKYSLLFTIGINTGLRAGDLRLLKYGQLWEKQFLELVEQKTGKSRKIRLNSRVKKALRDYYKGYLFVNPEAYLFAGQKGTPIEVRHIHKVIKRVCRELGIEGNYGSHTMRKTFAYHAYKRKPDIKALRDALNHSSIGVTRIYVKGTEVAKEDEVVGIGGQEMYQSLNL